MPLFYQHNINEHTRLAIWKIEEDDSYFLQRVNISRTVSHPQKRLQHLAGRWLLTHLFEDFPLNSILLSDSRKPILQDEKYHFSISHCRQFAAAIVSSVHRVGIDVETTRPRIRSIAAKFLAEGEKKLIGFDRIEDRFLTLLWGAKEAIYKWDGAGGIDFSEHIQLQEFDTAPDREEIHMRFQFGTDHKIPLNVSGRFFDELALAWVMS
jgi:phosphopantetheinyl transferase